MIDDETRDLLGKAPAYLVFFSSSTSVDILRAPVTFAPTGDDARVTVPHGIDRDVVAILPAVWYCLHLPNTAFELLDLMVKDIKSSQRLHLGHHIYMIPTNLIDDQQLSMLLRQHTPVIAICPDDLLQDVKQKTANVPFIIPATTQSNLSQESLNAHWRAIHEKIFPARPFFAEAPTLSNRLDLAPMDLPYKFLSRQMGHDEEYSDDSDSGRLNRIFQMQLVVSAVAHLERNDVKADDFDEQMAAILPKQRRKLRIPIALGLPGVPSRYSKRAYTKELQSRIGRFPPTDPSDVWATSFADRSDVLIERAAIEMMVTHHAIGRVGVGFMLENVPQDAFVVLAQLERHFETDANPRKVWRLLERLNSVTENMWTEPLRAAVLNASHLTVFSNFPLGILTMPGDTAPILCRLPVSYRPILPLTRAMQLELSNVTPVDLTRGVRILVAECIPSSDRVGRMSRAGWSASREIVVELENGIKFDIVETLSIAALREAILTRRPDVLVISAHGIVNRSSNTAGIVVGKELCFGLELGDLPHVVILSACQVSPRGAATVSVADMLLREGAMAVLGTLIPVDVRHNAILMGRFFANIAGSLSGELNMFTLLDVWHQTQGGNAVNDVLSGSIGLRSWAHEGRVMEESIIYNFMNTRSPGRLRVNHIYKDTEMLLAEMADEQRVGDRVRNWMRRPGYIPESIFYAFFGWPERVVLRPRVEPPEQIQ